jgi:gliding motility associated protien GldN
MRIISLTFLSFLVTIVAFSQEPEASDLMFKKEIIRAIDLREKQNQPLFSAEREITKLLMEATLSGLITPYCSDSLSHGKLLTVEQFQQRITIDNGEIEEDTSYMDWDEKMTYLEGLAENESTADYFFGKDLYQMELTEVIYFSNNSSEMRYKIKAITIFLPAEHPDNIRGIQQPIATFDFDKVLKVFANNPDAIWFNPSNDSEHRSLADAFELRLFSSYIIKVSNPNDEYLVDIADGNERNGILNSTEKEYELLEFESNFWEN